MDEKELQSEISTEETLDPHCASCGMSMRKAEDFGTDSEGERSEKYCCHCMQGGSLL
jgi:hypothetical protein